jgi:hypothetical protein
VDVSSLEDSITKWGAMNRAVVKQIYVIGEYGRRKKREAPTKKSDFDLLIFLQSDEVPDTCYADLADIGLANRVLIHPLFILEKDKRAKLNINEYSEALREGRRIY